jgi:hypothetical protein
LLYRYAKGLETFGEELAGGPFYAGRDTPGLVDYALFPWLGLYKLNPVDP